MNDFLKTRLQRVIQRQLENPLAEQILSGKYEPGDSVVVRVGENGELVLDLEYEDDSKAEVDMNVAGIATPSGIELVEVQGTA